MSIFIIPWPGSGRRPDPHRDAAPHRPEVTGASCDRRRTSGAIRACGSEQELLDALRVADHSRGEVTLLDPGACANSLRLQRLLPYLHNAYWNCMTTAR